MITNPTLHSGINFLHRSKIKNNGNEIVGNEMDFQQMAATSS
jgi:hypothetical protein